MIFNRKKKKKTKKKERKEKPLPTYGVEVGLEGKRQGRRKPDVLTPLCSCSGESQEGMQVFAAVEKKGKQAASAASEEEEGIQEDVAPQGGLAGA